MIHRRVLVDTHALLWWQAKHRKLSRTARTALERADAVLVSAVVVLVAVPLAVLLEKFPPLLSAEVPLGFEPPAGLVLDPATLAAARKAAELRIKVDKRWGDKTLAERIEKALKG